MNKNIIQALIITICTCAAILLICAFSGDPDSSGFLVRAQIVDVNEYELNIQNGNEIDFLPDMLMFNGVPAVCDQEANTYYLPQSMESEEFEGELKSSAGNAAIYFLEDEAFRNKSQAIASGHSFSFILCEGNNVMMGKVVFTGMPAMSINYTDGEIQKKEEHAGTIVLSCADDEQLEIVSSMSDCIFHVRGNSSYLFDKKNYRVSLYTEDGKKNKINYLGLREDDDWILNSMYTDVTRSREKVAYDLWEMVNAWEEKPVASSKLEYVELFINHEYIGIYALMIPVDGKQMQMKTGDILYKLRMWMNEYRAEGVLTDYNGQSEIPNGNGYNYALIKYPTGMSSDYDWSPLMMLQNFVYEGYSLEQLEDSGVVINRSNMVLHNLFCELTNAMDNTWKNNFVAAYKTENEGYELYQSIWDLNYIFGDEYLWDPENRNTKFSDISAKILKPEYNITYLYNSYSEIDDSLWGVSQEMWTKWRDHGLDDQLVQNMLEENQRYLEESGARTREDLLYPETSDESSYESVNRWIEERFNYLDEYYAYDSQR